MAYEEQTKEAILQRMLDASDSDIDKRQGAITFDMLSPSAIELALAYIELDNVLTFGFAGPDQPSEYQDRTVGQMGLTRKPSVKATGQVTFTGSNGTVVPIGSRVSTDEENPLYFVTTATGTIASGTVTVAAEAEVGGVAGNVSIGRITLVVGNLSGVTAVTNSAVFDGGADTESDEALLARYYDRVRRPATSGNANHYRQWALEIAGIGDAKVYPTWNGNGTVKVVLLDTDKTAPIPAKVTEVADYIESVRPVNADVTVVGATEVPIDITATVTLVNGKTAADAKAELEPKVIEYLKTLAFVDPIVRFTQIGNLLLDCPSVIDYSGLTVNGVTANVSIADGSAAVLGTVVLS